MMPRHPFLKRASIRVGVICLVCSGMAARAVPPVWWSEGDPPVIDSSATANNRGVANIGQAKWVAKSAIETLRHIYPEIAEAVEADLVGAGKAIESWDAPVTQAQKDKQRAPLLLGQLKAMAAPFYDHLHAVGYGWLEKERTIYGMPDTETYYPWTESRTDDANKAVATIGQLKAVFSLDFAADRETGDAADGLSDLWEYGYFGNLDQDGTADSDGDGITDAVEYLKGTNPVEGLRDVDEDDLPDDWEIAWFGNTDLGATSDPDDDGVNNLQEFLAGTDPTLNEDSDEDDLPDDWERVWFFTLDEGAEDDHDDDHVSNLEEYTQDSDPASAADTDGDGLPDDWEVFRFTNITAHTGAEMGSGGLTYYEEWRLEVDDSFVVPPLPDDWKTFYFPGDPSQGPDDDPDGDGVPNIVEYLNGTDPTDDADHDGDGMPDDWEMRWFGNLSRTAEQDPDGDKVSNLNEFLHGTSPTLNTNSDTDDLPDDWEIRWFGDLLKGPTDNDDGDAEDNLTEYQNGTDPTSDDSLTDTDHDGLPDAWEMLHFGNLSESGATLHNGVSNLEKYRRGLDPALADTDGDGISDADEIANGTDPLQPDSDVDGAKDSTETTVGTNIVVKDHPTVELSVSVSGQ